MVTGKSVEMAAEIFPKKGNLSIRVHCANTACVKRNLDYSANNYTMGVVVYYELVI